MVRAVREGSMRLDRNIGDAGKYALVRMRDLTSDMRGALDALATGGVVDMASAGDQDEFFAIKLKDKYAQAALLAYADAAEADDPEYAADVRELAARAGPASPWCKRPD